jgi:formate-dependent nitrite reductase cytochrome c552 subunit
LLVFGVLLVTIMWLASSSSSKSLTRPILSYASYGSDEYVGSEACKDCHEDQFKAFSHTSHAKLANISSWRGKVTGCEACHGPGKAHVEEGDPTKIISFKNKSSKEISETCLTCHAGKEERNNFRRGEHWRNDIGCTDCHSSHELVTGANQASSHRLRVEGQRRETRILNDRTVEA